MQAGDLALAVESLGISADLLAKISRPVTDSDSMADLVARLNPPPTAEGFKDLGAKIGRRVAETGITGAYVQGGKYYRDQTS